MARQASKEMRRGNVGETEVAAKFQRLGWAALFNDREDIGTDLILNVRTSQGIELGLLIAAQVKTGPSAFREPTNPQAGEPEGWWFRDTARSHVDSWADHVLPHLIILYNDRARQAYWAHVTADSIRSTGKGAKVLVPKTQRIDVKNRAALVTVGESIKIATGVEGTAWGGLEPPTAADRWRYALIAPRLLAPHPNLGFEESIRPEQGVALLVQGRIRNYQSFAKKHRSVPDLRDASKRKAWGWRFVAAFAERILTDDVSALAKLLSDAPDAAAHSAVAVATACALLDQDRVDEALATLEAAVDRSEAGIVDGAWLEIQRARLLVEVGRIDEARRAALRVQVIRAHSPFDVTAGALAGAAAALLFNTSPWGPTELKNAITSGDTAVTWWRSQTTRRGLDALAERHFKDWAGDPSVTIGAEDTVAVQFVSASMLANHAADHGGWRNHAALSGQARLYETDCDPDPDEVAWALSSLLRSGDHKSVERAVRHVIADGPYAAVDAVGGDLRLERATRTTAPAELALLEFGGYVLRQETADRAARFLIRCVSKDAAFRAFVTRTSPTYVAQYQLLNSLAGVIPAASRRVQRQAIKHMIALPSVRNQLVARGWTRVVHALPAIAWTERAAREVKPRPRQHESSLQLALLGVAGRYDKRARRSLMDRAKRGSLAALSSLGDISELSPAVAKVQIEKLANAVRRQASDSRRGHFGIGSFDLAQTLVVLNCWHPGVAQWQPVLELLAEPKASASHKAGAIATLATVAERIPEHLREELGEIALGLTVGDIESSSGLFDSGDQIFGRATILAIELGAVDLEQRAGRFVDLLAGTFRERVWAARLVGRQGDPADVGVLAVLAQDSDPFVRATAAAGAARLVARNEGGELARSVLRHSLADPGLQVPLSVAAELAHASTRSDFADGRLKELRSHAVAAVRTAASGEE